MFKKKLEAHSKKNMLHHELEYKTHINGNTSFIIRILTTHEARCYFIFHLILKSPRVAFKIAARFDLPPIEVGICVPSP